MNRIHDFLITTSLVRCNTNTACYRFRTIYVVPNKCVLTYSYIYIDEVIKHVQNGEQTKTNHVMILMYLKL